MFAFKCFDSLFSAENIDILLLTITCNYNFNISIEYTIIGISQMTAADRTVDYSFDRFTDYGVHSQTSSNPNYSI